MRAKYLWLGIGVFAIGALSWLGGRRLSPPSALETSQRGQGTLESSEVARRPIDGVDAAVQAPQPAGALSDYQLAFAAPSLRTLEGIERTAHESNDAVLLARVELERTRVLRAAAGLPVSLDIGQFGNQCH